MKVRTLQQAKLNAERIRAEFPHYIQPSSTDYDMVVLADEIIRLEAEAERYRLAVENIEQRAADNLNDRETVHAVHAIAREAKVKP